MGRILIGNIKGPKGDTGDTGSTGPSGSAATITIGSTTTGQAGSLAQVTNSGTATNAIFDFVIPQGAQGEEVSDLSGVPFNTITLPSNDFPTFVNGNTGAQVVGKVVKWTQNIRSSTYLKNNGTTTSTGLYALDAVYGKTLKDSIDSIINDRLNDLIGRKQYTYEYSIEAGSTLSLTGDQLGTSTPSGYVPFGFSNFNTGNDKVLARIINAGATGTTTALRLVNTHTASVSGTVSFYITYVRSSSFNYSLT